MDDVLHKDELFGDKYKAFVLCEYTRELELIKKLIEVAEVGLEIKQWKAHGLLRASSVITVAVSVFGSSDNIFFIVSPADLKPSTTVPTAAALATSPLRATTPVAAQAAPATFKSLFMLTIKYTS